MSFQSCTRRLNRLVERYGVDTGCPACRDRRGQTVLASSQEHPLPCPACGEVAERVIEIVECIVERQDEQVSTVTIQGA